MNSHICPALWKVRTEDYGPEDYEEIRAETAKEAACIYAETELADSATYGEGSWVVFVEPVLGPQGWKRFTVRMEMEPVFSAQA